MSDRRKSSVIPPEGKQYLKSTFNDYCEGSTLHGIKYLVQQDRPWIERSWWIFATLLSFIVSISLISRVWTKWNVSPVIVSFAESPTSIWDIPFPAITICSETKSRGSLFNFTHYHYEETENLTSDEIKHREVIALLCDPHISNDGTEFLVAEDLDFIEEVAPTLEETLFLCKWGRDMNYNCTEMFTPIMTDEGLCYTTNILSHDDFFIGDGLETKYLKNLPKADNWDLMNGFINKSDFTAYPKRTLGSGKQSGLTIVLKSFKKDLDYLCRGAVQGFKILLHNPVEIPRVAERFFRVPLHQEVVLAVKPDMMTTSEILSNYSPERRQCFFPHERKLAYFNVYTQRNCELECLTNYTLKACGCVSYYMPRSNKTKICGILSKDCTNSAIEIMVEAEIQADIQNHGKKISSTTCNCLTACTSIQYDAETSQATFEMNKFFNAYKYNMSDPEIEGAEIARVSIYYKDNQFITSNRNELYGYADFLAGCGGLLGLCSGFSVLSLVEIVYFATIRLYNNVGREKKFMKNNMIKKA